MVRLNKLTHQLSLFNSPADLIGLGQHLFHQMTVYICQAMMTPLVLKRQASMFQPQAM